MIASGLVKYHDALEPLLVPIEHVRPHPENYNNGDIDEIAVSIQQHGMYRPVYAQHDTGFIVAGNGTYHACLSLDADTIPVIWLHITDHDARRILGADNWVARLAIADPGAELALLEAIVDIEPLIGLGKTETDLARLRALDTPLTAGDFDDWHTIHARIPPDTYATWLRITDQPANPTQTDTERLQRLIWLASH